MCNRISRDAAQAFLRFRPFRRSNTEVVVTSPSCAVLKLYGNVIAENLASGGIRMTMAGWGSMTTAARLNAVMATLGLAARWRRRNWMWWCGDEVLEDTNDVVEVR